VTWEQVLLALGAMGGVGTVVLGYVVYKRGTKADKVLDVASNIQTTFSAQAEVNDTLREDNRSLREDLLSLRSELRDCETRHREALQRADEGDREVNRLKTTVNEHEETIARHELTMNQLRAGTPADRRES